VCEKLATDEANDKGTKQCDRKRLLHTRLPRNTTVSDAISMIQLPRLCYAFFPAATGFATLLYLLLFFFFDGCVGKKKKKKKKNG